MPDTIKDGSSGNVAKVDSSNRLHTRSRSDSIQHAISDEQQEAYQCIGEADLAAGIVVVKHIKNTSSDKKMVITYIRHQIVIASGGTVFPNASNYFRIALNRTYVSGGSEATPVNVYVGSGNGAELTVYTGNPTLTGTALEIDRWYTKAEGDMSTFRKEGAVIIPPNRTLELSYVGNHSSGLIYCRLSFLMDEIGL